MAHVKKKLLRHLAQGVYCKLGVSPIHGIGVFAIRAIPKGINPMPTLVDHEEIKFSRRQIDQLPKSVRKQIEIFCYHTDKVVKVPTLGFNTMNLVFYMNHSKNPNMSLKNSGNGVTLRAIRNGEELTFDYDANFGEEHTL